MNHIQDPNHIQDLNASIVKGEDKLESYMKRNIRVDMVDSTNHMTKSNMNDRNTIMNMDKDYSIKQVDNSFESEDYLVDGIVYKLCLV